jgi:ADP-ribose pyrophosphatase YjhB (NUDIX family)
VVASDLPASLIDASRLIEETSLRTGEGKRLVGIELATFRHVALRGFSAHVVAAVILNAHGLHHGARGYVEVRVASVRQMERVVPERVLRRWSESLAAVAMTGLGFTESQYEAERFEEILKIAGDIKAAVDEDPEIEDAEGHVQEWMKRIGKGVPGYQTPKVAVGAAVSNDDGDLLLIQRADSGVWLYPTGWCDVGYSAAEVVVKEVEEETGIEVEPIRLIAVLDGLRLGMSRIPIYSLLFHCRAIGGSFNPHPLEVTDLGWFNESNLPSPLVGYERWGAQVFGALRGDVTEVLYDTVRAPTWRGEGEK